MENIYERLLLVVTLLLGVCLPYVINFVADLFDQMRPGKKLQEVQKTLNRIAAQTENLPSSNSLIELTGQVEKLERVISKRFRVRQLRKKTKTTPKSVVKHINGAANK